MKKVQLGDEKRRQRLYWVLYSICFFLISTVAFSVLFFEGKSFINVVDGLSQQYVGFVRLGMDMRSAVTSLISGEGLALRDYSLSMGYGNPVTYYGDVFSYFSMLSPSRYAEYLFNFLVIVRLWFVGAAFSFMCFRFGQGRRATLVGALVYVFSSFGLQSCMQSQFLIQAMVFPLVVWGANILLKKESIFPFIVTTSIALYTCGLYSAYMMLALVGVFVLSKLIIARERMLSTYGKTLAIFLGCLACSAMVSLPVVVEQMSSIVSLGRLNVEYVNPVLYTSEYYQALFGGFIGLYWGERDWFFGFGAYALIFCLMLFSQKGKETLLKYLFVLSVAFVAVPFFGLLLNGLTYTTNRWIWAMCLLISFIVVKMVPKMGKLALSELRFIGIGIVVYSGLILFMQEAQSTSVFMQLVFVYAFYALLLIRNGALPIAGSWLKERTPFASFVLIMLGLAVNYGVFLSPTEGGWSYRMVDAGSALAKTSYATPSEMVRNQQDEGLYRYDKTYDLNNYSTAMGLGSSSVQGLYGVDFYSSLYNNDVDIFHEEMALVGTSESLIYSSLDSRSALDRLFGVKYFIQRDEEALPVPYGLSEKALTSMTAYDERSYTLYEIEDTLSMAFVYQKVISREAYEALNPLEKQEALLQGAIVDSSYEGSVEKISPEATSEEKQFTVQLGEGVSLHNNVLSITQSGATVTLLFSGESCSETYLYVEDLTFSSYSQEDIYSDEIWGSLSTAQKNEIRRYDSRALPAPSFSIEIDAKSSKGTFSALTANNHLYNGRDTWLWNLGYSEKPIRSVSLTFNRVGEYTFSDLQILNQPFDAFGSQIDELAKETVRNLEYNQNSLSCDVDSSKKELLYFSVPYSEGWSATVNGEEAEVIKANTAFMAVELSRGENHVILQYENPYAFTNAIAIGISLMLAAGYCIKRSGRLRKVKADQTLLSMEK